MPSLERGFDCGALTSPTTAANEERLATLALLVFQRDTFSNQFSVLATVHHVGSVARPCDTEGGSERAARAPDGSLEISPSDTRAGGPAS